jgi:queuine tRNA-ribosyltransferase/7-cyano-7-deazaguanine tRNA-ribosyltransferase
MFHIENTDSASRARAGTLTLPNGTVVKTPAYVIVGTYGEVKLLSARDLESTKTQMVICNTYHLWPMHGEDEHFPGLHGHMGWNGCIMTDSGGFQALSLGIARTHGGGKIAFPGMERNAHGQSMVEITREGILFNDKEKDFKGFLTPEKSMAVQNRLGSDIAFVLDECTSPLHDKDYTKASLELTNSWELKSLQSKNENQLLYGIVQGGTYEDLRVASARFVASHPFDGFGIGGSLGHGRDEMIQVLAWTIPHLPSEKPRHLLGIGRIQDIFDGVEQGVDTFDCIIPTRHARNERAWTHHGWVNVSGAWRGSEDPIDAECDCKFCAGSEKMTRGEIWKIGKDDFRTPDDMRKGKLRMKRILSYHNVRFFNKLMEDIRLHIRNGTFGEFKKEFLSRIPEGKA